MTRDQRTTRLLSTAAVAATTLLWSVLAWRTPTSTFHFAPVVAVGVGPWLARNRLGPHQPAAAAITVGLAGIVVGSAIAVLASQDRMLGPTFWSESGAVGEAIIFAGITAVVTFAWLVARPSPQSE